jgi:hypothetical protein
LGGPADSFIVKIRSLKFSGLGFKERHLCRCSLALDLSEEQDFAESNLNTDGHMEKNSFSRSKLLQHGSTVAVLSGLLQ